MPCAKPLQAFYSKEVNSVTGKRGITFQRSASFSGAPLWLPCGKCPMCRLEQGRQWAMRCLHEKLMYKDNVFLTLTYDDVHLPYNGSLVRRDLTLFMKRLREFKGPGIRFFACGEYGDLNARPHYHVLLFNCDFSDKLFYSKNARGDVYYTSKCVSDLWPDGFNILGDVTFDSAAYVARYCLKKVSGVRGVSAVYGDREPEFTAKSNRPGLGTAYYLKYGNEVRAHDNVIVHGKEVRPPRFYDSMTEVVDPALFLIIKKNRLKKARLFRADNCVDRRRVREIIAIKRCKQQERSV